MVNRSPTSLLTSITRLLFGRRLRNDEAQEQRIGPLRGVPVLGLDALGSSSYGPEAALTVLMPVGAAGLVYMGEISVAILLLLGILYFSYRQVIAAYPGGGGAYTVAKENLGPTSGLIAAGCLLLDYTLNVAVGISAGVGALESVFPMLQEHTLLCCLIVLSLITIINLRGVRDSGLAWSLPTYAFVAGMLIVVFIGVGKFIQSGGSPDPIVALPLPPEAVAPISVWLILRAFSSGCTAMTGVEAVSNGVPLFAEPAVRNARRSLLLICTTLALLLAGVAFLANVYHVAARSQEDSGYQSIISQVVGATVGRGPLYLITMFGLLGVLTLSANTSFASFPRLCGLLAESGYLPAAFAALGRRLVYSSGIVILFGVSALLLVVFGGITEHLIPLFAVGAFGAFTFSQIGMVTHWRRHGCRWRNPNLMINAVGAITTASALIIILIAKFKDGAWISFLAIAALLALFILVHRHYQTVLREIEPPQQLQTWKVRALKVLIPIEGWNRITERALRFAMQISDDIVAVHISPVGENTPLTQKWSQCVGAPALESGFAAPRLVIVESPYRRFLRPFLDFVQQSQKQHPDRLIAIIIPELVEPTWWQAILHNHTASILKAALLLQGSEQVVVINIPWYLKGE